jgi:hypothetical protein
MTFRFPLAAAMMAFITFTACAQQSAIPLGNDMMEINVSAARIYGRAGAHEMAFKKAAEATIAAGYDKFIVLDNAGWNELVGSGFSQHTANVNQYSGSAQGSGAWSIGGRPEVKMLIKMFHNGDKGSEKAVDAQSVLDQPSNQSRT